jgi:hypothetical protein
MAAEPTWHAGEPMRHTAEPTRPAFEPTRGAGPPVASGAWTPAFADSTSKPSETIRSAGTVREI